MVRREINIQFHMAVGTRRLDLVRNLIRRGADINYQNPVENSALHIAVENANGHLDVIQFLIKQGAIIDCFNSDDLTPLYMAVINRDMLVFQELVKSGAKVDTISESFHHPLYQSILNGDVDITKEILKKSKFLDSYLIPSSSVNALHLAVKYGYIEIVKVLLNFGANIALGNSSLNTPLHIAVIKCDLNILKELLKFCTNVDLKNDSGSTPLHYAVNQRIYSDDYKLSDNRIKHLFAKGLIEYPLDIVKELILYGAKINEKNKKLETPLSTAVKNYEVDPMCTRTLIKYTVFKFDTDYETIISLENCEKCSYDAIKNYFNGCASEIAQMKSHVLSNRYSLFDIVSKGTQYGDVSTYMYSGKIVGQILVPIPVPPEHVLALKANRDDGVFLVLFFDTKRTWQWLPRDKLEPLGVDRKLDKVRLVESKKAAERKAVKKAFEDAIMHRCRVTGESKIASNESGDER